jgi:anti-anti-sigma factor
MAAPVNFMLSERALDDRTALLSAEGAANAAAAERLARHVTAIFERGKAAVIVDLSGVTFVDSALVGGLADAGRAAQAAGRRLFVVEPVDPKIAHPLEIGRLDLAAVVFPTLDAAARGLSLPGGILRPAIPPSPPPPRPANRPRRSMFGRRELDQEILRELGQLRRSVQELTNEAGSHEAAASAAEAALAQARAQTPFPDSDDDLEAELAHARAEADRMEEEAEQAHARIQVLEGELEQAREALDTTRAERDAARSEVEMLREDVARVHDEVATMTAQASHAMGMADELERARAEADRMEDEAEQAHARIQALEGDLAAAADAAESLREELARGPSGGEEAASRMQTLETDLARAQTEASGLDADTKPGDQAAQPPAEPADNGPRPLVPVWADARPINLNTATLQELMLLPGIGRRPAERIIEFRDRNNGLKTVDDLYSIDEIPKDRITRIRPYVRV